MAARPQGDRVGSSNATTGSSRCSRSLRSCWPPARRPFDRGRLPRARDRPRTLYYGWRDKLLEGGERAARRSRPSASSRRRLQSPRGRPTSSWGKQCGDGSVRKRVDRSRQLVARGRKAPVVARVMQVYRQGDLPDPEAQERTRPTARGWPQRSRAASFSGRESPARCSGSVPTSSATIHPHQFLGYRARRR